MKNFTLPTLLLCLLCTCARAQKTYFQQDVSYQIDVRLDDVKNELRGTLELKYQNNSPDQLDSIPFHCFPRAYSSDQTAFAQQKLRHGSTRFHFSEAADRGTMDSLAFTVDGVLANHYFDPQHPDIAYLRLPKPLVAGGGITIRTPFRVKIPKSFSRMGRVGDSYQITQWYPKPAVYDRAGWHAMPYLDLGEYYADFGEFTVNITLPDNYIVGATGALQTASERQRLLAKSRQDRATLTERQAAGELSDGYVAEAFPPSSPNLKTISYRAERVHDFAWFADKRFKVLHDTLLLDGQPAKDVWAMFNETEAALWIKATDYLKRATRFYSGQLGAYPYPQVTGVMSALSVGGGMEYPMITVIGRSSDAADLDEVLAHEVGHNWFQGILGTNERDHAWMDEGFNTFYEQRYMAAYWPDRPKGAKVLGLQVDYDLLGYRYTARQGLDQAPNTTSDSLALMNYWIEAYSKPAMALRELEAFVGTNRFDIAMRQYYEMWKFRHPGPEDFFGLMRETLLAGQPPFLEDAMMTNLTSDWRVYRKRADQEGSLRLGHKGVRRAPALAQLTLADGEQRELAVEPANTTPGVAADPVSVALPSDGNPLDLYASNNLAGGKAIKLKLLTAQESIGERQLFVVPLLGFNKHDGLGLGAALHNRTLEPKRLEWVAAPVIGLGSGRVNGLVGGRYRQPFATGKLRQLMISYGLQRFSDFTLATNDDRYDYYRHALRLTLSPRHAPASETDSRLTAQYVQLQNNRPGFGATGEIVRTNANVNHFVRLGYQRQRTRVLTPLAWSVFVEQKIIDGAATTFNANHLRLDAELNGGYQYERGRFLRYRAFGGYFISNDLRESSVNAASGFSLIDNAASDYRYDELFLGRNASGWYQQQLGGGQGGFRAPISPAFGFGTSNSYLVAFNVDADLPALPSYLPLGLFLDSGYYGDKGFSSEPLSGEFNWVGGVSLTALEGKIGLYLPLIADPDTKVLLEQRGGLIDRLTFRLNLAGLMPWRWMDDLL